MKKIYIIKDNEIIIYPYTDEECNITAEERECEFCIYSPENCGHYNPDVDFPACDWITLPDDWEEIEEMEEEE